ncbi:hypothetical protein KOR34_19260 [Posidoniimonas corsicana]|uniref:PEP-CTERM protein-sorting domain-containing protein n=1 Tax=Posidoniimonas corsicana TaxID=1938618 RepID=A0A5C5VGA8_9BACT|nr:hypothetical protein [Posidoniimonas corsicana]TWT36980.1 hypothetical protein KOR34_19260 [Posidoniimonas corsicana]
MRFVATAAVAACLAVLSPHYASGVLLVYEGFDYSEGALSGQADGGFGFAPGSSWGGGSVVAGSLSYTDGGSNSLPTSGNRALVSAESGSVSAYRQLGRGYGDDPSYGPGTYWLSFLGQRLQPHITQDENAARSFGLQLHSSGGGDERLGVGRVTINAPVPSVGWGLFSDGSASLYTEAAESMFDLSFNVVEITIADATDGNLSDSAKLWVNPDLSGTLGTPSAELAVGSGLNFDYLFDTLRLWAGGTSGDNPYAAYEVDEIRIGTLLEDVLGNSVIVPGDVDGNGTVDVNDLTPIRMNYRNGDAVRTDGDLNGDTFVNFADFRQWKTALLEAGGSLEGVDLAFLGQVPEPASALLLFMGSAMLVRRGRR